jgi:prepilin-type N-terminal cleavage/methylation domain-containing protein
MNGKNQINGFTLVEVIVVLSILGILAGITIPSFLGYIERAEIEVCPGHGDITYVDGKVQCSVHQRDGGNENDDDDGSVPFL